MTLRTESITPEVLQLLEKVSALEVLTSFSLGGGTSLALRFGHRRSVDLDFFAVAAFDSALCQDAIAAHFPGMEIVNRTPGSLCAIIQGIKIDILHHPYPLIGETFQAGTFKLIPLPDMAAMKINALDCFCRKYGSAGRFLAIRSLNWFEDAEAEPDPLYLNGWTWPHVREKMSRLSRALVG
jgi:hypothetical protein